MVDRAATHVDRTAIVVAEGTFTYRQLLAASARVAARLLDGRTDLDEARVAFMVEPGFPYAATQWGIWRAGGIAVPLCTKHPEPELAHVVDDAQASIVVADPRFEALLRPVADRAGARFVLTGQDPDAADADLPRIAAARRAMMLYTSGTTGRPKGVVTTHENVASQITSLIEAWGWRADDRILLVLPLHHIHGIVNVLGCALWAGATCEVMPGFNADGVWQRFRDGGLTLFMAVPTIYSRLIAAWEAATPEQQETMSEGCRQLRLMVSGSAALPVTTLEKWCTISGHTLLERYGMTEIGMALSNPLRGERLPGHVGSPLPGVEVRLVGDDGRAVPDGAPGEIRVRGKTVFGEYWNRPGATRDAFENGWFKTGDVAVRRDNVYRILGRSSVDIIKTGGEKVSALEIEEVLRTHEAIDQCAVVGAVDPEWGQRVCAAVVLVEGKQLDLESLRDWAKQKLAVYKVPRELRVVDELPRNAMGKVIKSELEFTL